LPTNPVVPVIRTLLPEYFEYIVIYANNNKVESIKSNINC